MTTGAFLHPYAKPSRLQRDFIRVVSGTGSTVTDAGGNTYIDAMASLWYANVGYGQTRITEAVTDQMNAIAAYHCFEPFSNEPAEAVSQRVADHAPIDSGRVFLTSSGSEAVDSAMKLARVAQVRRGHPERTVIVTRGRAYHGVTYGGLSAQGLPANQEGFGPFVDGIANLPPDDIEATALFMAEHGHTVAAIMTEPVQGAGGVFPPTPGYLAGLRKLADQHDTLLIFDEVISGFGRLGHWFGAQHFGVTPDLIAFAKAVTSGYIPLGGVIMNRRVSDALESDPTWMLRHGHTYSGHPTACAAALANLDIIESEGLLARAPHIGERLFDGFDALQRDGLLREVRHEVAVGATVLGEGRDAFVVRDALLNAGVITRAVNPETLTWCPPLVITDAEIDRVVDSLSAALRS